MKPQINLFIDSGAFSAWQGGFEIDLKKYIDFIHEHKEFIHVYACLDVINNAEKTWQNQLEMEKQGLSPIITYHTGEELEWLEKYVERYPYIAIGGTAGGAQKYRQRFLDECWHIICDTPDRKPRCKVHGFGIGALNLKNLYKWHSVDSTTWVTNIEKYPSIIVPKSKNGKVSFNYGAWKIASSDESPDKKDVGKHILNLSEIERQFIKRHAIAVLNSFQKDLPKSKEGIGHKSKKHYLEYFSCIAASDQPDWLKSIGKTNFLVSYYQMIGKKPQITRACLEKIVTPTYDKEACRRLVREDISDFEAM